MSPSPLNSDEGANVQPARARRHERYLQYQAAHPHVSYAEWSDIVTLRALAKGGEHATLGPRLRKYPNWWDAGVNAFDRYRRWFPLTEESRVVDYGCGSLRIGGQFIRYLKPGGYFGLDVVMGLIDIGKDLVGEALMAEKTPRFAVISPASVSDAASFSPDIVCSSAVSYHVHPDEAALYFGNLAQIANRPGATLFFDASVSSDPVDNLQLSMPLDYFKASLADLDFVKFHEIQHNTDQDQIIGVLEFRRASGA